MATLADLQEQKRDLEARLDAGDLTAEAALARLDAAIAARTKKIAHSQKRLAVVKQAVERGVPVDEARAIKPKSAAAKRQARRRDGPINKFD